MTIRSRRRWQFFLVLGLALVSGPNCQSSSGCSDEETAGADAGTGLWSTQSAVLDRVPEGASAYGLARDCDDAVRLADRVGRVFAAGGPEATVESRDAGIDGGSAVSALSWSRLRRSGPTGIDGAAPCAIYRHETRWGFAADLVEGDDLANWLDRLAEFEGVEREGDGSSTSQLRLPGETPFGGALISLSHEGSRLRAEFGDSGRTETEDARSTVGSASDSNETTERLGESMLARASDDDDQFAGVAEPRRLLEGLNLKPRAQALLNRMQPQFERLAFGAGLRESPERLEANVLARSDPAEPVALHSLGEASGELPPVGGLVEPGVIGVLKLSVDPVRVYEFLVSSLPARTRRRVRAFWKGMRSKLLVSRPKDVLEAFSGHVLAVFYGIDGDALQADGAELFARMARLELTREAILLPLDEQKPVEQVLDKLTQISKGRLSRQKGEHTIQYAWIEEGRRKWGVILSDDYAVFVDTPTAFDRAMAYERRGHRLDEQTRREMRLAPLLDESDVSGLYLDTGTLARLLAENGRSGAARWLSPFHSTLLTTRMQDDVSQTRLEFVFGSQ